MNTQQMDSTTRLPTRNTRKWMGGLVLCLELLQFSHAGTIVGRFVGVADGDTITVLDSDKTQYKVRLAGIDAPEKKQAFGNRSKQSLSELVFGKPVVIETGKEDRYGRQVGKVLLDGRDVNLIQVERGMVWFYRQYQRELSAQDRDAYAVAEAAAANAGRGFWSDTDPVPPWAFRHARHASSEQTAKDSNGKEKITPDYPYINLH